MDPAGAKEEGGGISLNIKRVLERILRFWYFIVLSLVAGLTVAFIVNRYSAHIYPVKASIIIKENEENAGAKFLYNNALINPHRNFLNEIYIMKSFPLLQEVLEDLRFDVSFYREGDILTTEYYDPNFPVVISILPGSKRPYGKSMYFQAMDQHSFSLQYITSDDDHGGKEFAPLAFNDTIAINGYQLYVKLTGSVEALIDKKFVVQFNDPLGLAKQYSSKLNANWAAVGASVVDLEIKGPVAQKEIDFLNKFIERYQFYDIENKNKVATMAIHFLDEQLLAIGDSLRHYEDQVEDFKRRNIITTLEEETNRLYAKIKDYDEKKFQLKLIDNYYTYISQLLENDQYDGVFTPASVGITDNIVVGLITQIIELQTQVNIYKSNLDKGVDKLQDNPRLAEKLARIEYLKRDVLKTIANSRATQDINVKFIDRQIGLVNDQLSKLPSTQRELVTIKRNYSLKENLYVFLLQKRTEAGLSKASTTSDIVVVNPPMAGGSITPKVGQNYVFAAVAGIALPLAVFVLLELLNSRIQSKDDIEKLTSIPIIGVIGHNSAKDPLIVFNKPRSALSESFRALRSNMNYFTGNKEKQVFMVTSSIPGEGKSFTTLNLATVFALAGKRTIIVGADLRKPKLFDDLSLNNSVGLSQYLSGMATREEVTQATQIENLFLISGGPMPPNPSELLLRSAMGDLIEELKKQYDFIVMDTPPLSFVTDAFVLSKFANHSLFVVRQDFTPRESLRAIDEFYEAGKLARISVLFNDIRKTGLGYGYGYSYGYGYGYGYGHGYHYGSSKKDKSDGYYSD
ncbi:capsular exopolysaccharide family [Chryseolinea serpens]|uniref:Capsular exopolysaccharide family n=2 Tax=Chryseolinea serpens TaxID=947013 RepID=A0A1M5KYV3_9BACT|nr:capsular exopolysaccharide family [Chryseolinea serpens]